MRPESLRHSRRNGNMSITASVAEWIANYDSRLSIGSTIRARRIRPLLSMIEEVVREGGSVTIIDIGGTERYWNILPRSFLDQQNVQITIVNVPGTSMPHDYGRFIFVEGDGCNLAKYRSGSFHIAHSNSVIEHVGDWQRMVRFSNEISRLAQRHFVQTPNCWFPIEPHCMTPIFHWIPKPTRIWLVRHFQLAHWRKATTVDEAVRIVEGARLLNKQMSQELFKDSNWHHGKTTWTSEVVCRHESPKAQYIVTVR